MLSLELLELRYGCHWKNGRLTGFEPVIREPQSLVLPLHYSLQNLRRDVLVLKKIFKLFDLFFDIAFFAGA